MENVFVTITGQEHFFGMKPFKVGGIIKLVKEPCNTYDREAIRAELPYIDTIGYVANSVRTVCGGTSSAENIYDKMGEEAYARIMFVTSSGAIAVVMENCRQ